MVKSTYFSLCEISTVNKYNSVKIMKIASSRKVIVCFMVFGIIIVKLTLHVLDISSCVLVYSGSISCGYDSLS